VNGKKDQKNQQQVRFDVSGSDGDYVNQTGLQHGRDHNNNCEPKPTHYGILTPIANLSQILTAIGTSYKVKRAKTEPRP
jgi:hypothetical protein